MTIYRYLPVNPKLVDGRLKPRDTDGSVRTGGFWASELLAFFSSGRDRQVPPIRPCVSQRLIAPTKSKAIVVIVIQPLMCDPASGPCGEQNFSRGLKPSHTIQNAACVLCL